MKTLKELLDDIGRRLSRTWADVLTGTELSSWPHQFPLGQPTSKQLGASFETFAASVREWRQWSAEHGLQVS